MMSEQVVEHICPTCKHNFCDKYALDKHISLGKCREPPICKRCIKDFKRHCDLERHLRKKNPCVAIVQSEQYFQLKEKELADKKELKEKELALEERKLLLEEKKLADKKELKEKELVNALAIEKEKTERKKIISRSVQIKKFILNYDGVPKDAIDNLTYEECIKIMDSGDVMSSIVVHLYNNPKYEKYQCIKCIDISHGKWIPLEYDTFFPFIRNNSRTTSQKIHKITLCDDSYSSEVRIKNCNSFQPMLSEHDFEINNPDEHIKKRVGSSLPIPN
jgi:hypothetical protein